MTSEHTWWTAPWLRPFPEAHHDRVVVVAAHPGDETLGVGGLVQRYHDDGSAVEIVVATDGTAAGELRDTLVARGLRDVPVRWLGLPDGALGEHRADLAELLREPLRDADMCLAPWPDDPHPDHRAAGAAARRAAPPTTHLWSYPIRMWQQDDPVVPRDRAFAYRLTESERRRKAAGISAFASHEPANAGLGVEIVFRQPPANSAPVARFADLYAGSADPWGTATKWYERRKRALALAALPDERYGFAVEPACGVGVFTRALADRCDRLLAFDPVPRAVRRARVATADLPHVRITPAALPGGFPDEPVDLVVFGEILYYLDDTDLAETLRRTVAALRPGGHVLAVHWRPWAAEAPRDGAAAHRALLHHPGLASVVEHHDDAFLLHVLARR